MTGRETQLSSWRFVLLVFRETFRHPTKVSRIYRDGRVERD